MIDADFDVLVPLRCMQVEERIPGVFRAYPLIGALRKVLEPEEACRHGCRGWTK